MQLSRRDYLLVAAAGAILMSTLGCAMLTAVGTTAPVVVPDAGKVMPFGAVLLEVNIGNEGHVPKDEVVDMVEKRILGLLRDRNIRALVTRDPKDKNLHAPYALLAIDLGRASITYSPITTTNPGVQITQSYSEANLIVTATLRANDAPAKPVWRLVAQSNTAAGFTQAGQWKKVYKKVAELIADRLVSDGVVQ